MPRPVKQRIIDGFPDTTIYKPAGVPAREIEWIQLALDEFEAIRLVDLVGLDQEETAAQMGVSRPTVTRILASARSKITRFLVEGKALAIEGGPVVQRRGGRGLGRGGGRGGGGGRKCRRRGQDG